MTVREKAYAKINLFLDVTGRRDDGFHSVETFMQAISLCDDISFSASSADNKNLITITSDNKALETNENNLIYKAALKYLSEFNICAKIDVQLKKRIPIGAGLGGGSSDAAATLRAMNRIFGLATDEQLFCMAEELGSDVPFCIKGGSAFCTGRGEKIRHFTYKFYPYIVVAIGEERVSTPKAYSLLDDKFGDFTKYNEEKNFPDMGSMPIYNIFEIVINSKEINTIKKIMTDCGAKRTLMSGSGPSVFGGFSSNFGAIRAEKTLKKQGFIAFKCKLM